MAPEPNLSTSVVVDILMLPLVKTNHQKLENYKELISEELFQEIKDLAKDLKGLRVFQVNATPRGGGVAELLKSLVPLMKGVGLKAEWYTIPPREDFFKITKEIHNALQGKEYVIPFWHRVRYLEHIERSAELMRGMKADIWVVHDPQPAGLILYLPHFHPAICRVHIDLTSPNQEAWKFFAGIFGMYDKIVLSSKAFIKKEIKEKAVVFPPAIDPLAPKNQPLKLDFSKEILKGYGIDPLRPLISQVSRFDPWKGFLELIDAYQIARKKIPDLQLALVGFFLAKDDPEAMKVYRLVKKRAEKDPNIFLFFNPEMLGSLKVHVFVNAIQVASNVIVQNSPREGFGLCVLPNTEILTEKGPIQIRNINKGDKVLTGDGTFHRVLDKTSRIVNNYLEIMTWKGIKLGVTKDHPFLSTSRSRKARPKITEGDLHWVKAENISRGNFIAIPIPKSNPREIIIDLAKYDEKILSNERYVYYKMGFSGKRKLSYQYLSGRFGETKRVLEGAIKNLRNNKTPRSIRQVEVIERLNEIDFVFPEVEKINRFIPLNENVQWFIGWYIAEGDTNGNMIEINGNLTEIDKFIKLQEVAQRYFGKPGTIEKRDNKVRLIISSQILSKFFSIFGCSGPSKHIPDEWMDLGKHLKWMVSGILEGDGHLRENCGVLTTTSKKLAWQVWQILLADKVPSKVSREKSPSGFKSDNRAFLVKFGGREYHRFCKETMNKFGENPSRPQNRMADFAIVLDHFLLLPIKKIRKVNKETKVYDISVEGTHSFVGNGYLLHNSITEAMWKQKAVVGGLAEGIKLQIQNKKNGFLASNPQELAKRIIQLIKNPKLAEKLGKAAKETVKEKFLIPRLLKDYLKVFKEVIK